MRHQPKGSREFFTRKNERWPVLQTLNYCHIHCADPFIDTPEFDLASHLSVLLPSSALCALKIHENPSALRPFADQCRPVHLLRIVSPLKHLLRSKNSCIVFKMNFRCIDEICLHKVYNVFAHKIPLKSDT